MARRIIFSSLTLFLAVLLIGTCYAGRRTLEDERVIVTFDSPLQNPAEEVLKIYPAIRAELMKDLGWETDFRPEIVLIKDSASFRKVAESDLVTALAVPQKDLIVIDYSRMNVQPFTLGTTLKHELCHLELHHHIAQRGVPRWLDEGICQWVSGGLAEIITDRNRSVLRQAALSNRLISFEGLTERFPHDGRELLLAYEESRSVVEYIHSEFGVSGVRSILQKMGGGDDLEDAVRKSLSISFAELEKRWRSTITGKDSWFYYLGDNLYEILFLSAAIISICGFFRMLKKRKEYKDEEEEQDEEQT